MKSMPSLKVVLLGCIVLGSGLLTGYLFGMTLFGQYLPRLIAAGTVISLLVAFYSAFRSPCVISNDVIGSYRFVLFCLFLTSTLLGSSISATVMWQLSPWDRIAGVLPYSDALGYYGQVVNWPSNSFGDFNSRRPLNAVFNIMEFHLGGKTLLGMMMVRVTLSALAISAFIVALSTFVGRSSALVVGFVLLFWSWPYASSMLSEINGLTLSSAGYALLLLALAKKQRKLAVFGVFALVLTYAFRPANPLTPALFAIFILGSIAGNWRKGIKTALFVVFASIALIVVIPKALYHVYGSSDGIINGNTGAVVLGLARGTNWQEAQTFVAREAPGLSERKRMGFMYKCAIQTVKKDMNPMGKVLTIGFAKGVFRFQQEIGGALGFSTDIGDRARSSFKEFVQYVMGTPSVWITSLFVLINVVITIYLALKIRSPYALLGVLSIIAEILIAPFIFNDGGWRVFAGLYPGLAFFVIAIPVTIRYIRSIGEQANENSSTIQQKTSETNFSMYVPIALIGLVLLAMPYPAVYRLFADKVRPMSDEVIITVQDKAVPHWTGLNQAIISKEVFLTWSKSVGEEEVSAFLTQYGTSVQQIIMGSGGDIVLVCKNVPGIQELRLNSLFKVRILPYVAG